MLLNDSDFPPGKGQSVSRELSSENLGCQVLIAISLKKVLKVSEIQSKQQP